MTTSADAVFVDTNVLLGATDVACEHHDVSRALLETRAGLVLSAQVIREYLVVATRPVASNGLGLDRADALENLRVLRGAIRLLPEERPIVPVFLDLVSELPCVGKRLHDAFIVATVLAHKVPVIATWNLADYAVFGSRVRVISPDRV